MKLTSFSLVSLGSLAATSVAACSGATVDVGAFDGGGSNGSDGGGTNGADGSTNADGGAGNGTEGGTANGPSYVVHLRASQSKVTFSDAYAGETPLSQSIAIRKLTLYRDANDASPVVVFDNGTNAVECGVNDGNDTVAGRAVASTLAAGTFTIAHVQVGYYRFKVAATMHASGQTIPGDYSDVEVLTDNTMLDGKVQNQGHYVYTFEVGGNAEGTLTGEDLITPVDDVGGGLTLVTSGHEVDYVFGINVIINPALATDANVVMLVNTYQNFRWQDQSMAGYQTGVFDTTPSTYEPVMSFGANSFSLGLE